MIPEETNEYLLLGDNIRIDPLYFKDLRKDHNGVPTFSDVEPNKPVVLNLKEYGDIFGVNCMQATALSQQNFMQRAKENNWTPKVAQLSDDRVKLWYEEV